MYNFPFLSSRLSAPQDNRHRPQADDDDEGASEYVRETQIDFLVTYRNLESKYALAYKVKDEW